MSVPTLDEWKSTYAAWVKNARLLVSLRADLKRRAEATDSPEYRAALLSVSVMEREELATWMRTRMTLGALVQASEPGSDTLSVAGDVRFSVVTVAGPAGTHVWQVIAFLRNRAMVVVETGPPSATRELALIEGKKAFPPREWR